MKCRICQGMTNKIFSATIMHQYLINYYHCPHCDFLQTESPYWLDEAYICSINIEDTGYISRNITLSEKMTILLFFFFKKNSKFLDYAAGYGVFVRMMRDIGFDFYWSDKYTNNIFAAGFDWLKDDSDVEAVTAFECFEHFDDPMSEIEQLLNISNTIVLTTKLLPKLIPQPHNWWYYGLNHGQHISFYSKNTFNHIARHFGLGYYSLGDLHVLTRKTNISNTRLKILNLVRYGLHKLIARNLESKTWKDSLILSRGKGK